MAVRVKGVRVKTGANARDAAIESLKNEVKGLKGMGETLMTKVDNNKPPVTVNTPVTVSPTVTASAPAAPTSRMGLIRRGVWNAGKAGAAVTGVTALYLIGRRSLKKEEEKAADEGGGAPQKVEGPLPFLDGIFPPLLPGIANSWLLIAGAGVALLLLTARRKALLAKFRRRQ